VVEYICYNWMPTIADHILDLPEKFYTSAGTSRLHNVDSFNPLSVRDGDLIFVKTDYIVSGHFEREFLDKIYRRFNLITGVSSYHLGRDGGDIYKKILSRPNLNKWICTNPPDLEHEKIVPIPIGFEEPDRLAGNQTYLQKVQEGRKDFHEKSDMILLPYHSEQTNGNRRELIEFFKKLPFVTCQEEKQNREGYFNLLNEHKFVIGLEGSGPDIHRNYETMLVGSVPISIKNVIEGVFRLHSAEGVFLDSWKVCLKTC